jgi:hypothetical protein
MVSMSDNLLKTIGEHIGTPLGPWLPNLINDKERAAFFAGSVFTLDHILEVGKEYSLLMTD